MDQKGWSSMNYPIGTIIDPRSDGSYIYMSNRGILNLDNHSELTNEMKEDDSFLKGEK